jgi:branched-chain amino acid transport system substrate-binding protein
MVTRDGDKVNPFVFRAAFIDPFQGKFLRTLRSEGLSATRAVIMGSNSSDYAKDLASIFSTQFAANGGYCLRYTILF